MEEQPQRMSYILVYAVVDDDSGDKKGGGKESEVIELF